MNATGMQKGRQSPQCRPPEMKILPKRRGHLGRSTHAVPRAVRENEDVVNTYTSTPMLKIMKNAPLVLTAALAAAALSAVQPAAAQGFLLPSAPEKGVALEAAHPDFKIFDVSAASSIWYLSGRLPVTERLRVFADVPFAHAKPKAVNVGGMQDATTVFEAKASSVIGNPLLGIEYVATPAVRLELSARAPLTTADDESFADVMAAFSDPQRLEAFVENVVPVSGMVTVERSLVPGLDFRAKGGVTSVFFTGDESGETTNFVDYGVFGSYTAGIARLGSGVSGRWNASADQGSFSDRSLHQLGVTADVRLGGVRPGVSVRIPLDKDHREVVSSTVGMYLQVPLR